MSTIFISHSSNDNADAEAMVAWLTKQGHKSYFIDYDEKSGIRAGSDWEQVLYQRLRQCQAVIALVTPDWLESKWCFAEMIEAREKGKPIFPVITKPCKLPGLLNDTQKIDLSGDAEAGYRRLALGLKENGLDPADVFDWDPMRPPYPGLPAFEEEDAAVFFGRGSEIFEARESLRALRWHNEDVPRLVLVLGSSGSGKSSLVRAGLIPRLKKDKENWLPLQPFRPQDESNPVDALAFALADTYKGLGLPCDGNSVRTRLSRAAASPATARGELLSIARELASAAGRRDATVLISVDQAEELFGPVPLEISKNFLQFLGASLITRDRHLMAIVTLRSDFLGIFQDQVALFEPVYRLGLNHLPITVQPIPVERYPDLIEGPANRAGIILEGGLIQRLLQDAGQSDSLPLLAFTLRRLYDLRFERSHADRRAKLAVQDYEKLGGLAGAVQNSADQIVTQPNPAADEIAALRDAFIPGLVRINDEGSYSRRRAFFDQLPTKARSLLKKFINARLLVAGEEGQATVEIAHEALLRTWPTLVNWLVEDRDRLRQYNAIAHAAQEWNQHHQKETYLVHRDGRLEDAKKLVSERRFAFSPGSVERDYLDACTVNQLARETAIQEERQRRLRDAEQLARAQAERAQEAEKRAKEHKEGASKLRWLACVLAAVAFAAVVAAAFGFWQRRETERQKAGNAKSFRDLALVYDHMGAYAKAEPLFRQAIEILQKVLGPNHPDTASSLDSLAALYDHMGDYPKAEPLFRYALHIKQEVLGPNHPDTASSLNNLAALYEHMGDYAKAEPLFQQALHIRSTALGPNHPDTASSLNNLAVFYDQMGDYAKAEPLFQQALQIREDVLGPNHPDTASSLNNLAALYEHMGDHAKAEPLFQQALQIREKVLAHPDTASSLDSLAALYDHMGDYAKAEPLFDQAFQIRNTMFGLEHPDTASSLYNLGLLYDHMGDYAKAEPLFQQALQIREKLFGPEHPDTASSLYNLGLLYDHMGDCAKAEPLFQQALQTRKRVLGLEHPDTASSLHSLALLKIELGDNLAAKSLAELSGKADFAAFSNVLSFASEQERLAYAEKLRPYDLFSLLKGSEADIALAMLRFKGVVLDSIIEDRLVAKTIKEGQDRDAVGRLAANKRELTQLLFQKPEKPSVEIDNRIADLEREVEQIEGQLARHVSGLGRTRRALSVTVEQVQARIPKDGALIEYLRYMNYLGKGKSEPSYGAIVLASTGQPSWIPLGEANELDDIVHDYQQLVRHHPDDEHLSVVLEKLYAKLWAPIEQGLPPEARQAIISPDGQLNFISFATLVDSEKRFLAEKYNVQYVSSGRDLLFDTTAAANTEIVIFANPNFDLGSTPTILDASEGRGLVVHNNGWEDLSFSALPGTQEECDELTAMFESWAWKVGSFTRSKATKEQLLLVHSPYILHLATHSFFEPQDESTTSVAKSQLLKNPMRRSGLALAGAQTTKQAWKRGEAPPLEKDGIVTAEDIAALDLKGTWLVTLSACDTGFGEAKAGEGVMGLRRGFIEAGAQNLLMALWPIDDYFTVKIMRAFYAAVHQTGNASLALANVQRDYLVELRKAQGIARATSLAGPFIMSSQGKP